MRYLHFILNAMLLASFAMAQEVPQGPSPLTVGVYEKETNTDAKVETAGENGLQSTLPKADGAYGLVTSNTETQIQIATPEVSPESRPLLVTGSSEGSISNSAPAQTEPVAGTNKTAQTARASFLMSAGIQYADDGEYKEAEQAYLRALDADPGNRDLLFRLSTLYIKLQRYEDAASLLEKLVADFPNDPTTQNNLAWVYAAGGKMKNGKQALRHARDAILLAPYEPFVWHTLAEAYYVSGQYDTALKASDFATELLRGQAKVSKEDLSLFGEQHEKIKRAAESYNRLMGLDSGK